MSKSPIPLKQRLIAALDLPTAQDAKALVEQLGDAVSFYKLGLELFMAGGYHELIAWLCEREKQVFADLKFFDIPETVGAAVAQISRTGASFVTVHGNDDILRAAVKKKNGVKVLAVTVLTSLDRNDLNSLGFSCDMEDLVLSRAKRALELGCDGVISSGIEVSRLRRELGERPEFIMVAPGIRPFSNNPVDDQKRTVTLEDAFKSGADYVVVGREIRNAADPRAKAEELQGRIAAVMEASAQNFVPGGPRS